VASSGGVSAVLNMLVVVPFSVTDNWLIAPLPVFMPNETTPLVAVHSPLFDVLIDTSAKVGNVVANTAATDEANNTPDIRFFAFLSTTTPLALNRVIHSSNNKKSEPRGEYGYPRPGY
jgi:hypothetical protein